MNISIKTSLPGPKAQHLISEQYQKYMGLVDYPYPFIHKGEGSGCYVKDVDENVFLDGVSQLGTVPLGYCHPRLSSISKKYSGKTPLKFAGHDFYPIEHGEMLVEVASTLPNPLDSIFFINSGAEAVENAIKICYRNKPSAKFGISFYGAFHGRTLGALSMTCSKSGYKKHYPEIPVKRLPYPTDENYQQVLADLEKVLNHDADPATIGYIIFELVQGEGGFNIAPKPFVKELREITAKNEIPLIVDEVWTGMARTGKFWCFEHYNIVPDVLTSAKALQVAATITSKKLFPKEGGAISSTWGGGSIMDLAMGREVIRTIRDEHLAENASKIGSYILKLLEELQNRNAFIGNPRGLGLMAAFDLPSGKHAIDLMNWCYKHGLLILPCGKKSVRIAPPLVCDKETADELMSTIEEGVKELRE